MGIRGKKSQSEIATLAKVVPVVFQQRLEPPLHINDAMRQVWIETVNDQPADAFTAVHIPILEMYCGHVVKSRLLNQEIENFDLDWLRDDDGLKRYDRLTGMAERESRAASSLATRLRITRQSTIHPVTAGRSNARQTKSSKPWQRPQTIESK